MGVLAFLSLLLLVSLPAPAFSEPAAASGPEWLISAGRWAEAEAGARAMVEKDSANVPGWYLLGRVLFERGRPEELEDAVAHLSRAVSLAPDFAPAWFWLGRASGQLAGGGGLMERIRLARRTREAFVMALELEPDNFEFAYAMVQFYLRAPAMVGGGGDKAEAVVLEFKGFYPAERLLLQASLAMAGKDDDRVLSLLAEVGDMDDALIRSTWEEIALQLGRRALAEQSWTRAVGTYRLVVERMPGLAAGYLGLGRSLEGKGNLDSARVAYRRCVELCPDSPAAEDAKARLTAVENG